MADLWSTEDLPAHAWTDDPDDPPHIPAHLRAQGIPGGTPIRTLTVPEEYL